MRIILYTIIFFFSLSFVYSQQDSVFTTTAGDSLIIWDTNARENCASRFKFSILWLDSNEISLTETDTIGPMAECICTYNLSAILIGLGPGFYSADVHRAYLARYGYSQDTTINIGTTSFTIGNSKASNYSQQFYQSDCLFHTTVVEKVSTPEGFTLDCNFPNPFNPTTVIQYSIPHASMVTLKVLDLLGREVTTLVNKWQEPGAYKTTFDGDKMYRSGVYFYQLQAGNLTILKKMILIK
jgi:hypothetical protein